MFPAQNKRTTDRATVQHSGLQLVGKSQHAPKCDPLDDPPRTRKGGHTVPSTLTLQMQQMIVASVRQGRSVAQTAKEYNCTQNVVTELWLRDLENVLGFARQLMRRAG
jgi:hypothetical protein